MPEIITRQILSSVLSDYNIPVMSLIFDEMTGENGYITRIEAFVDMLNIRRENNKNEKYLYWN
jgi:predicted nucleotide-binding protein (sugar kinase/HSP70/actin superfamily)